MKYQAIVSYVMWEEDDPDTVDLVLEFTGGVTKILTVAVVKEKEKEDVKMVRELPRKKTRTSAPFLGKATRT